MTDCTKLSDRMPEVARGRSRWTADEERHLAACADCRAEWRIVTAASRLGTSLPAPPDPTVVSGRVLERLRFERGRGRSRARVWTPAVLAAAAAVALAVWTGQSSGRGATRTRLDSAATPSPVATVPARTATGDSQTRTVPLAAGSHWELPMPELDSLPAEALDSILRVLDEPLAQVDAEDLTPDDPGDQELEQALAGLEG